MPAPIEREIRTPCEWCGNAIEQPPRGRKLRYCDRSCRQRAYELRTAQGRHGRDLAAGHIRAEPAERVVERVIQPRHPSTTAAWESTLASLAEQVRTGRIGAHDHARIEHALAGVNAALGALADVAAALPAGHDVDVRVDQDVAELLDVDADAALAQRLVGWLATTAAGAGELTTITRLAGELGIDAGEVRAVLADVVDAGAARVVRTERGVDVDVDPVRVAEHARFTVRLPGAGTGPVRHR